MAVNLDGVLDQTLQETIKSSRILVVGAGGIGCELLKNLVLTGFNDIELIDLDTIDVSNLNRQFLFRKEHVGKSKAKVARESALKFNPHVNIKAIHDSIISPDYGRDYFRKFEVVMNALDNKAARNHVNRMCLAANVPLIESGSGGYLGQVTVIKKGVTECYECQPKAAQKTYPGCTIRNTPSEPIHCIVWAKHLFNQLFGESDPDEDVSPDAADPELVANAGQAALQSESRDDGNVDRVSTRAWAAGTGYNACKIFNKLFKDDIKYLLSMEKLWEKRRKPVPLDWDHLDDLGESSAVMQEGLKDQKLWSISECRDHFQESVKNLRNALTKQGENGMLVWDKDDEPAMDFVTAAANIRAHIFGIPTKTRFDIKSMAGNIIPAIATTNAIVAGLIVLEGIKVLKGQIDRCKTIYMTRKPNPRKKVLIPCQLVTPNPKCYVCAEEPEVTVRLNMKHFTVKMFEDRILKGQLGMVAPDVDINGTILISSEEGETEENNDKPLADFNIRDGTQLKCDDFLQEYKLAINIYHVDELEDQKEFELLGDISDLAPKPSTSGVSTNGSKSENTSDDVDAQPYSKDDDVNDDDDDDDIEMIVPADTNEQTSDVGKGKKRKASDDDVLPIDNKKTKQSQNVPIVDDSDDDVVTLD
ncbi:SUMO-activating enzyme subunit 2-like [Tubulanus polymorphus]|uniref:SUMO-activating enzyme subunit 2-like n=1 Tax=Tubulanus polymorphus TaxID=672921 RepID=UPI003DA2CC02